MGLRLSSPPTTRLDLSRPASTWIWPHAARHLHRPGQAQRQARSPREPLNIESKLFRRVFKVLNGYHSEEGGRLRAPRYGRPAHEPGRAGRFLQRVQLRPRTCVQRPA